MVGSFRLRRNSCMEGLDLEVPSAATRPVPYGRVTPEKPKRNKEKKVVTATTHTFENV